MFAKKLHRFVGLFLRRMLPHKSISNLKRGKTLQNGLSRMILSLITGLGMVIGDTTFQGVISVSANNTITIVDTLGTATPTTQFSLFGSGGQTIYSAQSLGPEFTLTESTTITEIGGFVNSQSLNLPFTVEIRPSLNDGPDPNTVLATYTLSHDNDPFVVSYESATMNLILGAGTYFALFASQGDDGGYLLASASDPFAYQSGLVRMGVLDPTTGFVYPTAEQFGAVRILGFTEPIIGVNLDIKPGSFPNSVNLKSEGVIPVAILTTDSFDASTVDADTVLFGVTGTESSPIHSALSDVDNDGDLDMIFQFPVLDTGLVIGDTQAQLTGETLDGQLIEGSDSINIVSKPVKIKSSVVDLGTLGGSYSYAYYINEHGQVIGVSETGTGEYRVFFWDNRVLTDVGSLGNGYSDPYGINDRGQVFGSSGTISGEARTFFWEKGVLIDVGALGGSYTYPQAMSESGQIIGISEVPSAGPHAFLWENGVINDLGTLGGSISYPGAINESSQIVGYSHTVSGEDRAFLWQDGNMVDLGTLGGSYSYAQDINLSGQILGFSETASGEGHPFLWENGIMQDLGTLGGYVTYPLAFNENGQVIGYGPTGTGDWHAFLWENDVMRDLGTLGGSYSITHSMNESGQIIGNSQTASGEDHAFLWDNGVMTDLGTLGGAYSYPQAINERGEIIGISQTASGEWHAFLWKAGIMTDLTSLGLLGATAINDRGQIIGVTITPSGDYHAALLKK